MKVWVEVNSDTTFKEGDVVAESNEVVISTDGDRATLVPHKRLVLRPVKNMNEINEVKKSLAKKLHNFIDVLLS